MEGVEKGEIKFGIYVTYFYLCDMKGDNDRLSTLLGEGGKFFLDIAKLVIGGVLLAGIMKEDVDRGVLYGIGIAFVLILTLIGFALIWMSKTK